MIRLNKVFLSAKPLNHIRFAYIGGINLLTIVCILVDDCEIIKSGAARPESLILVFSAEANGEKLTPYKYFTLSNLS